MVMRLAGTGTEPLTLPPVPAEPDRPRRIWALALAAILLLAATVQRACWAIAHDAHLDSACGTWVALADDLLHGTFYRPVESHLGFGGTRYFPLHFVLHAGLMRAGMGPLASGYLLATVSGLLLLAGLATALRALGLDWRAAAAVAALALATLGMQRSISTIRGDLLPAALSVCGVAAVLASRRRPRLIWPAAALLVLAFSAKATTVFGPAAAVAWLWIGGRRHEAMNLGIASLAGAVAVLVVVDALSAGRFHQNMLACASGGGGWAYALGAPVRLLKAATDDPASLLFAALAVVALAAGGRMALRSLPALLLFATAAVALLIFASPGAYYNHLIDLHIAAILALGMWLTQQPRAGAILAVSTLAAMAFMFGEARAPEPHGRALRAVAAAIDRGPILSEDPMVPVLAGQRPVVLDPFMLRVMGRRQPDLRARFLQSLADRKFSAVILLGDVASERFDTAYFGPGFADALATHYQHVLTAGTYRIFRARPPP